MARISVNSNLEDKSFYFLFFPPGSIADGALLLSLYWLYRIYVASMKYVLVSGGSSSYDKSYMVAELTIYAGVISGIGKGVIGMGALKRARE